MSWLCTLFIFKKKSFIFAFEHQNFPNFTFFRILADERCVIYVQQYIYVQRPPLPSLSKFASMPKGFFFFLISSLAMFLCSCSFSLLTFPKTKKTRSSSFFFSQRTGHVRVLSFKLAIAILCQGPLEEKYRCKLLIYLFASK